MFRRIQHVRPVNKSTNDRFNRFWVPLFTALLLATAPVSLAGPAATVDPYSYAGQAMAVSPDVQHRVDAVVADGGPELKRLRRLHEALLAHDVTPVDTPDFAFRVAGVAREAGIVCFFAAVDVPAHAPLRAEQLAAGVYDGYRIVVFEGETVRRLPWSRVRLIGDTEATALLLAHDGQALLRAGANRRAIEMLETAVRLEPKLAHAWHDLGAALRREGQGERALDAYEHSLALAALSSPGR